MTQFNKKDFTCYGGCLEYHGTYEGQPTWDQVYDPAKIHPSRIGVPMPLFVARFKYTGAPFTRAIFQKELIKSFTVEEYVEKRAVGGLDSSPLRILTENNPVWAEEVMKKHNKKIRKNGWL